MEDEKTEVKYYYKKKEFNLKADKWVEKVSIDDKDKKGQGYRGREGLYKLEIHKTKIKTAEVKITYKIRITNTGKIEGTVGEIKEIIPAGCEYKAEDNEINWRTSGKTLVTTDLKDETIEPGKNKEIEITFRWKKGSNNLGKLKNTVLLSKIKNPAGFKEQTEADNSAESIMIVTVSTGSEWHVEKNAVIVVLIVLALGGITIIRIKNKKR